MTWIIVVILIVSGVFVGFINALAGGGTIISLSVFMFLGLPAGSCNKCFSIGLKKMVNSKIGFRQ